MKKNSQLCSKMKKNQQQGTNLVQKKVQHWEGRWSQQQHHQFLVGVMKFGRDWKKVEKLIPTRNGSQLRSHAQKYFIKVRQEQKRQKGKKKDITKNGTELERQLIKYFTLDDLTENTPPEIIQIMKSAKTDNEVETTEHFDEKNTQVIQTKPLKNHNFHENSLNDMKDENSDEQSYFIKSLRQYLQKGHNFYELIDFGAQTLIACEQSDVGVKRSFQFVENMHQNRCFLALQTNK